MDGRWFDCLHCGAGMEFPAFGDFTCQECQNEGHSRGLIVDCAACAKRREADQAELEARLRAAGVNSNGGAALAVEWWD